MNDYGFPIKLTTLLVEIDTLVHRKDSPIKDVLLSYCSKEKFIQRYDGYFWCEFGFNWEYNKNRDVVKLVDEFFIKYREEFCFTIPLVPYDSINKYKTRYDYLTNN